MHAILIALALAAAPDAQPIPVYIVTTDGRAMRVRGYEINGRLAKITALDGTVLSMRAESIDVAKTEARTAQAVAAQAEAERAAIAEQEKAEAEAAARAERKVAQAMIPRHRGGMSVVSGSAQREVAKVEESPTPTPAPAGADVQPSSGDYKGRLQALRDQYRSIQAKIADATKRHDDLAEKHNADTNLAERDTARAQMAELRTRIDDAKREAAAVASKFSALQEEARRSGAKAADWRDNL